MRKILLILLFSFCCYGEVINKFDFTPKQNSYIFLVISEQVNEREEKQEVIYRSFFDQKIKTSFHIKVEKNFDKKSNNFDLFFDIKEINPTPELPYLIAKLSKTITVPKEGLEEESNNISMTYLENGEVTLITLTIVNIDGQPISCKIYSMPTLDLAKKVITPTFRHPELFNIKK